MTHTSIHVSRKLEKYLRGLVAHETIEASSAIRKWYATVVFFERKKCWLITNTTALYNVILTDITAADHSNLDALFLEALYTQLRTDGIEVDYNHLQTVIGRLQILPTANDRRTIGHQNQSLLEIDWWRDEFATLASMPMNALVNRLNTCPFFLTAAMTGKFLTDAVIEMNKLLQT